MISPHRKDVAALKEIIIRMKSVEDLNLQSDADWRNLRKSDLLEVECDGKVYDRINSFDIHVAPPQLHVDIAKPAPEWICEMTFAFDMDV